MKLALLRRVVTMEEVFEVSVADENQDGDDQEDQGQSQGGKDRMKGVPVGRTQALLAFGAFVGHLLGQSYSQARSCTNFF